MKTLIFLIVLLTEALTCFAQEDFPEDGNVSRAVTSAECEEIVAKSRNGVSITLEKCEYGQGGIGYDSGNPNYAYYQDGELFNGHVQKNQDGSYAVTKGDDFLSIDNSSLPDKFKCDGKNDNELQCLVCSCYHEARGQNYQEKVMVGRVVLSRVMNPIFEDSVCGVVHERRGPREIAQFSWIRRSEDNCLNASCNPENLTDAGYKVNSYLGKDTGHKTALDKRSYGECVDASKEALTKRNVYFASYYFTGEKPSWAFTCEERFRSSSNRVTASEFAHTFYGVCEESEREFSQMLTSRRPRVRPPLRSSPAPVTRPPRRPPPRSVPGVS